MESRMIEFDRKIIHRFIVIVSISFILILLVNREGISKSTVNRELLCLQPPLIEQGSIDLDNWDLDTHGNVKLDGNWEFIGTNRYYRVNLGLLMHN